LRPTPWLPCGLQDGSDPLPDCLQGSYLLVRLQVYKGFNGLNLGGEVVIEQPFVVGDVVPGVAGEFELSDLQSTKLRVFWERGNHVPAQRIDRRPLAGWEQGEPFIERHLGAVRQDPGHGANQTSCLGLSPPAEPLPLTHQLYKGLGAATRRVAAFTPDGDAVHQRVVPERHHPAPVTAYDRANGLVDSTVTPLAEIPQDCSSEFPTLGWV
jgi:hypothetical protein